VQNLVDVKQRKKGLRWEGISVIFFLSILVFFVFLLTPTGHNRKVITTVYGSKHVFSRKMGPSGVQSFPKT